MKRVCIAGNEFSVEVAGDGPPLLLVHGFPLNYAMWSHQIDELRSSRLVISPDLRGFGGSALGSDVVTMETYADDLAAILDQLGVVEPVAVCGFSMGGVHNVRVLEEVRVARTFVDPVRYPSLVRFAGCCSWSVGDGQAGCERGA